MSWRNFENHKSESKAVKRFLIDKGYQNVKVGHDRGTAWEWLKVNFDIPRPANCYCGDPSIPSYRGKCNPCHDKWSEIYGQIGRELMEFTGRHGEYHGDISIDIGWLENKPSEINQSNRVDKVIAQILS